MIPECTCSEDWNGGDPYNHTASCEWANYQLSLERGEVTTFDLNELAARCHSTAVSKGFWDHQEENPRSIWGEKIALIHSEASEMLESLRDGTEATLAIECADLLIRLLDFTAARGIDIQRAVDDKMAINSGRPHLHGREF